MTRARDVATQGGLVLINKTTFTSASQVDVTNCFNSTYQNYRILFTPTNASTANQIRLQLILGTTPSTTSYSTSARGLASNGVGTDGFDQGTSSVFFLETGGGVAGSYESSCVWDLRSPNVARYTTGQFILSNGNGNLWFSRSGGFLHGVETAYDGMRLFANTGNFSGTIRIYGYRD